MDRKTKLKNKYSKVAIEKRSKRWRERHKRPWWLKLVLVPCACLLLILVPTMMTHLDVSKTCTLSYRDKCYNWETTSNAYVKMMHSYGGFTLELTLLMLLITIALRLTRCRNPMITKVRMTSPPRNYNPLLIAKLDGGYIYWRAIMALIMQMAAEGYIEIRQVGKLDDKNKPYEVYEVAKLKDYQGRDECKQTLMEYLFNKAKRMHVDLSKIVGYNSFGDGSDHDLLRALEKVPIVKDVDKEMFDPKNKPYTKFLGIAFTIYICWLIGLALPISSDESPIGYAGCLAIFMLWAWFTVADNNKGIGLYIGAFGTVALAITAADVSGVLTGLLALITMFLVLWTRYKMNVLSKDGAKLRGEVQGFREFITVVYQDRIKALVAADPDYFYKILPYAYTLNLATKWVKQFDEFKALPETPRWFKSIPVANSASQVEADNLAQGTVVATANLIQVMDSAAKEGKRRKV